MSSTVFVEDTQISITQYASKTGPAFQVTWPSDDKEHLFDSVAFDHWGDVVAFVEILRRRKDVK